jgi:hypothetical protein
MKTFLTCLATVITQEKLIPANLAVLGVTSLSIDMFLKLSLSVLMIVLTSIKIMKELKNKNPEK